MDSVGVGMIGYAFMGKSHSIGYRDVSVIADARVPRPRLVSIYGRDPVKLEEARERYGWEKATTDWNELVSDPAIQLLDNSGPNHLHVEPTLAAIRHGKHVYSEKPLAPTAAQSHQLWRAAEEAGVKHMCAFNYRFFPALRKARELIQSGELGQIHHYRSQFLLSGALAENRPKTWRDDKAQAGSGVLGDLGSHHIDLSRYLLGSDPARASGLTKIIMPAAKDGTDDCFAALLEYNNGAAGVLEASRVAGGHLVTSRVEVDGSKGSLQFSLQNLNTLHVAGRDRAFRAIHVIDEGHPYIENWFPPGHPLGWVDSFSHEAMHILGAIGGLHDVAPLGATFKDGYYCAEIVDTILRSALSRRAEDITYRGVKS